jgi:hypothetical protein
MTPQSCHVKDYVIKMIRGFTLFEGTLAHILSKVVLHWQSFFVKMYVTVTVLSHRYLI